MKNFLIGALAFVAIPIWFPLLFILSLYKLMSDVGGRVIEFLEERK